MAQRYEGEQNHVPHRLKGRDGGLLHRLNTAETQLALVIKLKNEAILAGYEDQETVRVLTNKLAAKEAKEGRLRSQLLETQTEISTLRSQLADQQITDQSLAESQEVLVNENVHLRDENAALRLEIIKLRTDNNRLKKENSDLSIGNSTLDSSNKLLKSQVGSLHALYGPGFRYSLWRVASQLPFVGQFFEKAARASYTDFLQRKQPKK